MARTVVGAAALFGVPVFSVKCAIQAVEVICKICAQVSPEPIRVSSFRLRGFCLRETRRSQNEGY